MLYGEGRGNKPCLLLMIQGRVVKPKERQSKKHLLFLGSPDVGLMAEEDGWLELGKTIETILLTQGKRNPSCIFHRI